MSDRPALALVVGCPRSGTTWLHRLLAAHPATVGPSGESTVFRALRPWFANASRRDGTGVAAWLPPGSDIPALTRRLTDRLLDEFVASTGATPAMLIEKTPGHVHDLVSIAACYPDVRVIHLVRDGRDVARSLAEMEHGTGDVRVAAQAWVDALASADLAAPQIRHYREVRYEDLLADPAAGAADLLGWLGLPVDGDVRDAVADAGAQRVSQYNTTGPVGAGKWQLLDPGELAQVYAVAGHALVARGYADHHEVARATRRPAALLARLRARTARRQPDSGTGGGRSAGKPEG